MLTLCVPALQIETGRGVRGDLGRPVTVTVPRPACATETDTVTDRHLLVTAGLVLATTER